MERPTRRIAFETLGVRVYWTQAKRPGATFPDVAGRPGRALQHVFCCFVLAMTTLASRAYRVLRRCVSGILMPSQMQVATLPAAKHGMGPLSRSGRIKEAFELIDANSDGCLSRAEVIKACKASHKIRTLLGLPGVIRQEDGSREVFEKVFQALDHDDSKAVDLSEFQRFFQQTPEWPPQPVQTQAAPSLALQQADAALSGFCIDDCPAFTRTILTSSPLLHFMHLSSGEATPLPHVAIGVDRVPSAIPRVRRSLGGGGEGGELELPNALKPLMQQHKRALWSLFNRWEKSGHQSVPVLGFAEGVQEITGVGLSDEDLLTLVQCVEPVSRDDLLSDPDWRLRSLDCSRLYRRLLNSSKRLASQYIKKSASEAAPTPARRSSITLLDDRKRGPGFKTSHYVH